MSWFIGRLFVLPVAFALGAVSLLYDVTMTSTEIVFGLLCIVFHCALNRY